MAAATASMEPAVAPGPDDRDGAAAAGAVKAALYGNHLVDESSPFECNVCLDLAKDPVVTVCGHLYCWRCLYRWASEQGANTCPVCKAGLDVGKVIPIYCRGAEGPAADGKETIPDRPQAQRPLPVARTVHSDAGPQGQQPGILPTLFGIHGSGQGAAMTPEQQHQAFLSRLLLLLGSFVILCLLLF